MIGRLILAAIVGIPVVELLKRFGQRRGWSGPQAFLVSFGAGIVVGLVMVTLVFGWSHR